jgi:hypothetical protein
MFLRSHKKRRIIFLLEFNKSDQLHVNFCSFVVIFKDQDILLQGTANKSCCVYIKQNNKKIN